MEIWLGGKHIYSEKVAEENPKETELEKLAKRVARTGTRRDLQRYLKARRNYR